MDLGCERSSGPVLSLHCCKCCICVLMHTMDREFPLPQSTHHNAKVDWCLPANKCARLPHQVMLCCRNKLAHDGSVKPLHWPPHRCSGKRLVAKRGTSPGGALKACSTARTPLLTWYGLTVSVSAS